MWQIFSVPYVLVLFVHDHHWEILFIQLTKFWPLSFYLYRWQDGNNWWKSNAPSAIYSTIWALHAKLDRIYNDVYSVSIMHKLSLVWKLLLLIMGWATDDWWFQLYRGTKNGRAICVHICMFNQSLFFAFQMFVQMTQQMLCDS